MSDPTDENIMSFQEKLTPLNRQEILKQTLQLESVLHDAWRETRKKDDGTYEPRVKDTNDNFWIMAHWAARTDIANTTGPELPIDLQAENQASAKVAINEVWKAITEGRELDESFVEEASSVVHIKWLERNASRALEEQKRPYSELSEEEKDKDRAIINIAIALHKKEIDPEITEVLRLSPTEENNVLAYFDMVGINFLGRFNLNFETNVNLNSVDRLEDLVDSVKDSDRNRLVIIINIINSVIKADRDAKVPESLELSYGSFTYDKALGNDSVSKGNMGVIIKKRLGEYSTSY